MTPEEALVILDAILKPKCLNDVQELVFRQSWQGKSYQEIAIASGYNADYIKDVGAKLWRQLSQALGITVTKLNLYSVITKYSRDRKISFEILPQSPQTLSNTINSYQWESNKRKSLQNSKLVVFPSTKIPGVFNPLYSDWQETIDVSVFYGRTAELNTLKQWICQDNCRLIAVVGISGIGKTALTVKLAKQVQTQFEQIIWQSLRHPAASLEKLTKTIQVLSNHQEISLPIPPQEQIAYLINYFQHHRCLVILDNFDSLFQSGCVAGTYCQAYLEYRELLQQLAETNHQSCLILTSREEPAEVAFLAGETLPIRALVLAGLQPVAAEEILKIKGISGTDNQILQVVNCYQGNPLLLKIAATSLQDLFSGSAAEFLEQRITVFQGIRDLLNESFHRLWELEIKIMYWLTSLSQPVTTTQLLTNIPPSISAADSLTALESLRRRFLLEITTSGFMQQPVIKEYMTEKLMEQVYQEMSEKGEINSHFLHLVSNKGLNCL
ncbi:NB-ARC domain-containing protein [Aerosakkonemataceae cyanobacterium BLCC-F154]|uniref:NB-ARC domain-containing protein n=1 Tax=Floridaenema fluviatile BLCC-F154 TaxID=3153640 RepID=A0ABV4Y6L1_9CYAN